MCTCLVQPRYCTLDGVACRLQAMLLIRQHAGVRHKVFTATSTTHVVVTGALPQRISVQPLSSPHTAAVRRPSYEGHTSICEVS